MKGIRALLRVIIMLLITNAYANEKRFVSSNVKFPETLTFNDEVWKLNYTGKSTNMLIAEYVTNGQTVHNWTQLFTYQVLTHELPDGVTAKSFAGNIEAQLKKINKEVKFDYIEVSDNEAIIEFRILKPKKQQQDEIQRIITNKDRDFYVLHYVVKKTDMGQAERAKWIQNIKSVTVPLKQKK